jgi:hypothetical protein
MIKAPVTVCPETLRLRARQMTDVIPVPVPSDLPPVASILREAGKTDANSNEFKSGRSSLIRELRDAIDAYLGVKAISALRVTTRLHHGGNALQP